MQAKSNKTIPWICLTLLVLLHCWATWIWLSMDNSPPLWDMALHQSIGLTYHDYYLGHLARSASGWWSISGAYPPFYHQLLALAFLLGRDSDWAVQANFPATLILVVFTFLLGRQWFSARIGLLASTALLGFPYMVWISRETVIDYTLAAVVLMAIFFLQHSNGYSIRRHSLAFGVSAGLAALTKWIGPLFIVLPALWAWRSRPDMDFRIRLRNFLDALILALGISLAWYLVKLPEILDFLRRNTLVGAAEGEPSVFSLQSAIYYLRLLEGEQLHALFFLLFGMGLVIGLRRKLPGVALLVLWVVSGYIGLTLLRTKDPRFTLPMLPAVALLSVGWIESVKSRGAKSALSAMVLLLSCGHYLLASFGWNRLPERVVIAEGYRGSYSWHWNLYSQSYQGLLGAPRQADWPQAEILDRLMRASEDSKPIQLGVIPDLPRFNHENIRLAAELRGLPFEVRRIGMINGAAKKLMGTMDFLIVAEGEQGMPWSTSFNEQINEYIFARPDLFQIHSFSRVPGGPALRLYRVIHP